MSWGVIPQVPRLLAPASIKKFPFHSSPFPFAGAGCCFPQPAAVEAWELLLRII
jgi:hypothetical protein